MLPDGVYDVVMPGYPRETALRRGCVVRGGMVTMPSGDGRRVYRLPVGILRGALLVPVDVVAEAEAALRRLSR